MSSLSADRTLAVKSECWQIPNLFLLKMEKYVYYPSTVNTKKGRKILSKCVKRVVFYINLKFNNCHLLCLVGSEYMVSCSSIY